MQGNGTTDAISANSLTYAYPGYRPIISDFTLQLPAGSRCLLIGANGAGKTTLLQILAGKHMVSQDSVRVLSRPAFHDIVSCRSCAQPLAFHATLSRPCIKDPKFHPI